MQLSAYCEDKLQDVASCAVDMTDSSEGASISDCVEWPGWRQTCNGSGYVGLKIENIYVTRGNISFNRSLEMIVFPESPPSNKAGVDGLYWSEYNVSHALVISHDEDKFDALEEALKDIPKFRNFLNHALLSTHVLDSGPEDFEIGSCPPHKLEVIDCRVHWCMKTFENVRTVSISYPSPCTRSSLSQLNGSMQPYDVRETPLGYDSNATISAMHESNAKQTSYAFTPVNGDPLPSSLPSAFLVSGQSVGFIARTFMSLFTVPNSTLDGQLSLYKPISNGKNVPTLLSNVVSSITNRFRTGPNATSIQGVAYYSEVFVVVRWHWCILPVVLIVLSLLLLASTVWVSCRSERLPLWKSSALVFLFHGLEGWSEQELSMLEKSQMQSVAGHMKARIAKNDQGDTKFIKVE